jgi:transposase
LKALETTRNQLVETRKRLQTELKESESCDIKMVYQLKKKSLNPVLKPLDKQIKELENQMDDIIKEDDELKRLTKIMTSVVGVGKVTATALLIVTQGFTKFSCAKKLACYAGVVPFEHTSGSSVRGKTRTSNFANKHLKSLLHLCALSAIRQEGELKTYYERKVKEGKKKMVALNAVRNKIIQRIVACVKHNRMYEKNYEYAFVQNVKN